MPYETIGAVIEISQGRVGYCAVVVMTLLQISKAPTNGNTQERPNARSLELEAGRGRKQFQRLGKFPPYCSTRRLLYYIAIF
jgi:hypothetical protein